MFASLRSPIVSAFVLLLGFAFASPLEAQGAFIRGDCDQNERIDITDAIMKFKERHPDMRLVAFVNHEAFSAAAILRDARGRASAGAVGPGTDRQA